MLNLIIANHTLKKDELVGLGRQLKNVTKCNKGVITYDHVTSKNKTISAKHQELLFTNAN